MTDRYLGLKGIGDLLGVQAATVSKWRARYADHPEYWTPKPTVWIDDSPGWSDPIAWKAWKLILPGRGVITEPLPLEQARTELDRIGEAVDRDHPGLRDSTRIRHVFRRVAELYDVDYDVILALTSRIMDQNPALAFEDCDVQAVATVIRSTRKPRRARSQTAD